MAILDSSFCSPAWAAGLLEDAVQPHLKQQAAACTFTTMEDEVGLRRSLTKGDTVILSTGSTAVVKRSYPAGYSGDVEILLDGVDEKERASGLTLPESEPPKVGPELGDSTVAQSDEVKTRAPSRRMED